MGTRDQSAHAGAVPRAVPPINVVSADGHCGARPADYRPFLESRHHADLDNLIAEDERRNVQVAAMLRLTDAHHEVIDQCGAIRSGGVTGAWDVERRLIELDREGIAAELVFPNQQCALMPFFTVTNRTYSPELRAAGARAYHRWLGGFASASAGRIVGVADPGPCLELEAAIEDVGWAASHGCVSVTLPGAVTGDVDLPPLWDHWYDPFWALCVERGLVLSIHAGHGHPQGGLSESMDRLAAAGATRDQVMSGMHDGSNRLHAAGDFGPRRPLWQLMFGGVFDRFPDLRLALTEVHADWVPTTIAQLDERFERDRGLASSRPSEQWKRNCYVCVSSPLRVEIEMRAEIGLDQMMFGADYVQPESTWPNTLLWLQDAFRGVGESETRRILGENAIRCYGLDEQAIAAVAARVGPRPDDLLGDHAVDPRLIADFHIRAAYSRSAENVDRGALDLALDSDLGGLAASPSPASTAS